MSGIAQETPQPDPVTGPGQLPRGTRVTGKLNLLIPMTGDRGDFYVIATPIGLPVFERHFMVLSRVFSTLMMGPSPIAAPRVAALALRQSAEFLGIWEGPQSIQNTLLAEIHRLTMVVISTPQGWRAVPWDNAVGANWLSEEDLSEVENILVFFTVASAMHRRSDVPIALEALAPWGAQTTSSTSSEFLQSLTRSIAPTPSAVPPAPETPRTPGASRAGSSVPI